MNRATILKRLEALEARKRDVYKPPAPILFGSVAVSIIA
jgi:hypothetical protein